MYGGSLQVMSMKLSLTPRLHSLLLFRQFKQSGVPSSHFKCLSLQVKQPVLTLLLLAGATSDEVISAAFPNLSGASFFELGEAGLESLRRFEGGRWVWSFGKPLLTVHGGEDCSA